MSEYDHQPDFVIPTIDPECGGGVRTVTNFTKNTLQENGYHPAIIYNSIDWDKGRTINDVLRAKVTPPVYKTVHESSHELEIGRVLPESEVLGYVLNSREWDRQVGNVDHILGVGGTCLPCYPLARQGYEYDCWIGTTLIDERKYQVEHYPLIRHLRYRIEQPVLRKMERYVLKNANKILVQSQYTADQVVKRYDVPHDSIYFVPFPIDTEQFRPNDGYNFSKDVIFVGRVNDPRKRVDNLVKAFSQVIEGHPDAVLHLVGDHPNGKITDLISQVGICSNVVCHGRVDDLIGQLRNSSLFVLPSDQEGLGIAGLEAMSTGLPVVATKCGGPEDYVVDQENGRLVPRNNPRILADAISNLLGRPQDLADFSDNARKTVQEKYCKGKVEKELVRLLGLGI